MPNDYSHIITIEPGKRFGQPCIRGMRITVYDILEYLAGGMAYEEILDDFPELTIEDIASIAFVADRKAPVRAGASWRSSLDGRGEFEVVNEPWTRVP